MKQTIIIFLILSIGSIVYAQTLGTFTDSRDGQTYKTVTNVDPLSGNKVTIMAENLNYKMEGAYAYDNNEKYRDKLGLLYRWDAALKACPRGWHLPSDSEWDRLIALIGGDSKGGDMKSTKSWNDDGNGTNESGFSCLPGGYRDKSGNFNSIGNYGSWWSYSEYKTNAWNRTLHYDEGTVGRVLTSKTLGFSCRCFRD